MTLSSISIRNKLIVSFSIITICLVVVSAIAINSLGILTKNIENLGKNSLPSIRYAGELRGNVIDVRVSVVNHVLYTEPERLQFEEGELAKKTQAVERAIKAYSPLVSLPRERELFAIFKTSWSSYIENVSDVIVLSRSGQKAAALVALTEKVRPHIKAAAKALDEIVALNNKAGEAIVALSEDAAQSTRTLMLAISVAAIVFAIALAALIVRGVSAGIRSVVGPMRRLAVGDLATEIPHQGAKTEIGTIADSVQVFKEGLIRMRALEDETAQARLAAEEQRKAGMRQMADAFERAVGGIVAMVSSSATELQATAQTMTATATQTAAQSTSVAAAAEEAGTNVGTVAVAAEELGASVQEIARQVAGSSDLAQVAVGEADQTAHLVQELSEAVSRIGDAVGLISSIASQTNLLALNATIEAARAGEAGRGFAVVAAEVKELASQTAKATEEITGHIHRIQGSTGQAVYAIGGIAARIREINGVAASIAAAVEEQGAATSEIVRNVSQAAAGTSEVTGNIAGVARASEDTGAAASQVLASASELSRQSEHLSAEVARFLETVRAA